MEQDRTIIAGNDATTRVQKIVMEHLCCEAAPQPEQRLVDDLGADSLDKVELVMAFEDEFDCEISDDDVAKWATVGDCIATVEAAAK